MLWSMLATKNERRIVGGYTREIALSGETGKRKCRNCCNVATRYSKMRKRICPTEKWRATKRSIYFRECGIKARSEMIDDRRKEDSGRYQLLYAISDSKVIDFPMEKIV